MVSTPKSHTFKVSLYLNVATCPRVGARDTCQQSTSGPAIIRMPQEIGYMYSKFIWTVDTQPSLTLMFQSLNLISSWNLLLGFSFLEFGWRLSRRVRNLIASWLMIVTHHNTLTSSHWGTQLAYLVSWRMIGARPLPLSCHYQYKCTFE